MRKFKYGLRKDYTMQNIYKDIKRKLHLTDTQMHKQFPDVCKAVRQEKELNTRVTYERSARLILNLIFKKRKTSCLVHKEEVSI